MRLSAIQLMDRSVSWPWNFHGAGACVDQHFKSRAWWGKEHKECITAMMLSFHLFEPHPPAAFITQVHWNRCSTHHRSSNSLAPYLRQKINGAGWFTPANLPVISAGSPVLSRRYRENRDSLSPKSNATSRCLGRYSTKVPRHPICHARELYSSFREGRWPLLVCQQLQYFSPFLFSRNAVYSWREKRSWHRPHITFRLFSKITCSLLALLPFWMLFWML